MRKTMILFWMILLSSIVYANLGTYETGETVWYGVKCLTDDGSRDAGCTGPETRIYAPGEFVNRSPSSELAEVNETEAPGFWRGNYTIPTSPTLGLWSIDIKLINSNGTIAGTIREFQIVNKSFKGIEEYIDELPSMDSKLDGLSADLGANSTELNDSMSGLVVTVNDSISSLSSSKLDGLSIDLASNSSYVNSSLTDRSDNLDIVTSAIELNVSNPSYGLNATIDYLMHTVFDYLSNIMQPFINGTLYTDMGKNFTANNLSISNLVKEINESISTHGDDAWATAMTTAQNDTLYSISTDMKNNFTEINESIIKFIRDVNDSIIGHGDASWVSAMTTSQNDTLYAIYSDLGANSSYLNGSISSVITHGDVNWVSAMTTSQNDTLYSISTDMKNNFTEINSSISGLIADVNDSITTRGDENWSAVGEGAAFTEGQNTTLYGILENVTLVNDSISGLLRDINISITTRGDENWSAVGEGFTTGQNDTLYAIYSDLGANASYLNSSIESVMTHGDANWIVYLTDAQNATLNAIYSDQGANASYLNASFSGRFDQVDTFVLDTNDTIVSEINKTPERVWNKTWSPSRTLTEGQVGIIGSISLVEEGPFNATYYNSGPSHILSDLDPDNLLSLAGGKWARNDLVIENLPVNITRMEVCFWAKKVGSPSGNLSVYMGSNFLYNITAASFGTSWAQNCTAVAIGNVSNFNQIILKGESDWNVPNRIDVGMDDQSSVYSFESSDSGTSWEHTTNELIFWIEIGATATSIADQINAKVINVHTHTPFSPCVGSYANFHWAFTDFKGQQLPINSVPSNCNMYRYTMNGSEVNVTDVDIRTKVENTYIMWAFWNNTADANLNYSYHIDCNNVTVTPPSGLVTSVDVDALFGFTEECKEEGRFNAVYGNQTEIDSAISAHDAAMADNASYLNGSIDSRFNFVDLVLDNVWSFLTNTSLGTSVWASATRTLTGIDWNIFDNWVTLQNNVWNATDRNLTYYQTEKLEAEAVWNYSERNLTSMDYDDYINWPTMQNYVWNRTDRNLTYYPDAINYSLIDNATDVWEFGWRTVHGFES